MESNHDTATAINVGSALGMPRLIEERQAFAIVPEGYKLHDLEKMHATPSRKRGFIQVGDIASFISLTKAEATDATRVYFSIRPAPEFTAIVNDHSAAGPGWRDYGVRYECPLSPEWKAWTGHDKKVMSQVDFAAFIESNLVDVLDPPSADMLEISRTLEAKKSVSFASGVRLSNGQVDLTFEEQISGTAAKGRLQIPEVFRIGVPVFEGDALYAVEARLRYRIGERGALVMWFELIRPHKIIEDAVMHLHARIAEELSRPMVRT